MIALCCQCDTVSVVISAGDESARPAEGLPAPNSPADAVRNPAQVSFWLLEPVADAAMTYFYAQLFAMDTEIRAMFPAAMDLQRRRFFEALGRIADAKQSQADREQLVPYLQELGRAHRKFGVRERHYEVFRRALLATLQRFAAPRWNETAKHAWEMAYNRAATTAHGGSRTCTTCPRCGRMELIYPWLQVIPAVSDEPAHDHDIMHGTIPSWPPRPPGPTGTSSSAAPTT